MGDAVRVFLLTLSALFPTSIRLPEVRFVLVDHPAYSSETRKSLAWRVALNSLVSARMLCRAPFIR